MTGGGFGGARLRLGVDAGGGRRALGLDQLGHPPALLFGLAQALLQAGDVGLERSHGGLRGLGATREEMLSGFHRAARSTFREQVALAAARPGAHATTAGRIGTEPAAGCLAALGHHAVRTLRRCPDDSGRRMRASSQAALRRSTTTAATAVSSVSAPAAARRREGRRRRRYHLPARHTT